jgi:hypothetical protein
MSNEGACAPGSGDMRQSHGMDKLTERQAYDAMFRFLDGYWKRNGKPDELGGLLGSMDREMWTDGMPGDPAMWDDWLEAVRLVTED